MINRSIERLSKQTERHRKLPLRRSQPSLRPREDGAGQIAKKRQSSACLILFIISQLNLVAYQPRDSSGRDIGVRCCVRVRWCIQRRQLDLGCFARIARSARCLISREIEQQIKKQLIKGIH